jgi:hypothetical protein
MKQKKKKKNGKIYKQKYIFSNSYNVIINEKENLDPCPA